MHVAIIVKFALNDKAKGFSWFSGDWFFNFIFVSLKSSAWMSLTCSHSFPRGEASGGLHLLLYDLSDI